MAPSTSSREQVFLTAESMYAHAYGGALDLANGFDSDSFFESQLKFQALFCERILVPDGFFYSPGPIIEHVRNIERSGKSMEDSVLLMFLAAGIVVPTLTAGDSLLENWNKAVRGIKPGEFGYPEPKQGRIMLERLERYARTYARWPKPMSKAMMPSYALELEGLFVKGDKCNPKISRAEISFYLKLKGHHTGGWHRLFDRFRESIATQIEKRDFRRASLEQVIVDHFRLTRFGDVYQFVNVGVKDRARENWPEIAVADLLLRISSTVYEAYQAHQFNCVGSLFSAFVPQVVDESLYSRVTDLNGGWPSGGGPVIPDQCVDPTKMDPQKIIRFRESSAFAEYVQHLRQLKAGAPGASFVESNEEFYRFLTCSYLPRVIEQFEPAVRAARLKALAAPNRHVSL